MGDILQLHHLTRDVVAYVEAARRTSKPFKGIDCSRVFFNHGIVQALKNLVEEKTEWHQVQLWHCDGRVEDVLPAILACKIELFAIHIKPEALLSTQIDATLGRLLMASCLVHRLRLQMTWTAGSSIPAGLAENQTIRDLDLTNCQFGEGGIQTLARALDQNKSLRVIRFDNCGLRDENIASVVLSLCQNPSLQGLDLKDNSCGTKGLGTLAQLLQRTYLSWLRLRWQRNMNDFLDISLLTCALDSNTSLILLDLSFNAISDGGISDLTTALRQNRTLRNVNLNDCQLTDASMLRIAQDLPSMKGLWKLYLRGGQSGEAVDQAMVKGLEEHTQLQVLELPRSFRHPKQIEYYLDLNRSGRRLITERILPGLWPLALEQAWNQIKGRNNGPERCANVFYFFLHNRILTQNG